MTREPTIKQLLAKQGIETRPSKHFGLRELWRGDEFLGAFSAHTACERFLGDKS